MPIFIKYDGIDGTASRAVGGHDKSIELGSFSFDTSAAHGHGSGGGSGKVSMQDFHFATPSAQALEVKLQDVFVSSWQTGGHAGSADEPDLLSGPAIIDACGGGDGSAQLIGFATDTDPF